MLQAAELPLCYKLLPFFGDTAGIAPGGRNSHFMGLDASVKLWFECARKNEIDPWGFAGYEGHIV